MLDNANGFFKLSFNRNTLTVALERPSDVQIQVFSLTGQLLESFDEYVAGSKDFDMNRLTQGNYIVRIIGRTMSKTVRIMVR